MDSTIHILWNDHGARSEEIENAFRNALIPGFCSKVTFELIKPTKRLALGYANDIPPVVVDNHPFSEENEKSKIFKMRGAILEVLKEFDLPLPWPKDDEEE